MKLLVIYDIGDNSLRLGTAEILKDFGLARVQYSAFAGDLNHNRRDMLEISLAALLRRHRGARSTDRIYLLPLCDDCFASAHFLGERTHFPDHRVDRWKVV